MAYSENNLFTKGLNNLTTGRLCGYVTSSEYRNIDVSCKYPFPKDIYLKLAITNEEIFEWSIFQKAADLQTKKNKCLIKTLDGLQTKEELFDEWYDRLSNAWLGRKKARLALAQCAEINYNTNERLGARINPNYTPRLPPENIQAEWEANGKQLNMKSDPKWVDYCADPDHIAALKNADILYNYSTPILGGSEILDTLDGSLIFQNSKNKKALTNDEILNLNLRPKRIGETTDETDEIIDINQQAYYQIKRKLKIRLKEIQEEREDINKNLAEKKLKNGTYELDTPLRDYIFDDNTIYQTLENLNLLKIAGNPSKLSMGAKCLLNHYENTPISELVKFLISAKGGTMLFSKAALLLKANENRKFLTNTKRLKQVENFIQNKSKSLGATTAGASIAMEESLKRCSSDFYLHSKVEDRDNSWKKVVQFSLPDEFGSKQQPFKYETPDECKGLPSNSTLISFEKSKCIQHALNQAFYLLPGKIVIPVDQIMLSK